MVDLLYYASWALLLGGAAWVAVRWLMPFVLAFITAALLQRPLRWLSARTRVPRGFLSGLLVVAMVAAVAAAAGGVGWWLWRSAVTRLGNEEWIGGVADRLTVAWERLSAWGEELLARLSPATREALLAVGESLPDTEGMLGEWLREAAGGAARFAVQSLPTLVVSFVMWAIATVFLAGDFQRVAAFLLRCLPPRLRGMVHEARGLCGGAFVHMARAYLILAGITFLLLLVGFFLLRIENALWLAALIAVVDVLPVLGVGTVLLPWAAVAALNGEMRFALWLLALYLLITVVRNLMEPRLLSRRVGLPPIATLLCLYVGLRVAGVVGMIVLPFALTVAVEMWRRRKQKDEALL